MNKLLLSLLVLVSTSRGFAADLFVETLIDPNVEPGRETSLNVDTLYPLVGVPTQVALHPKVLSGLGTLQQLGDKAVAEAKTADATLAVTNAVISAQTWARKIATGEQKFWVFTVTYRKGPKGQPSTVQTAVAHFVAGAYTFHDGKKVFKLESNPAEGFPFLGTFPPKEGVFKIPAPAPAPTP